MSILKIIKKKWKKSQKKLGLIISISLVVGLLVYSLIQLRPNNPNSTIVNSKKEFIQQVAPKAEQLDKKYHVKASIIIAQALLESEAGQSELAATYHNLFGVKAGFWERKVKLPTKEYTNNQWQTVEADFKVYNSWDESLEDHTKLLVNGTSWNHNQYHKVIAAKTYAEAAQALQDAGYATDPSYAKKIINVIEEYQLYQYDQH